MNPTSGRLGDDSVRHLGHARLDTDRLRRTGDPKVAARQGRVVNLQPEYDDVVAAARAAGRPVKAVLAETAALARTVAT